MQWPTAAASRIRVSCIDHEVVGQHRKCQRCTSGDVDSEEKYYRLFYNEHIGTIELVPTEEDFDMDSRQVYDDANTGIENEPAYQSYIATMKDANRTVADSFHPDNVIGVNLSLEYNMQNPNTFHGMQRYSSNATINIYAYPKMSKGKICTKGRRSACHKKYAIDSRGCEDFRDARLLIDAIRSLACLQSNFHNSNNPSRYLVILNPFSGGGGVPSKTGAKHIYETRLNPMLEQAGIEHDVLVTGRGGHARDRMSVRNRSESQDAATETSEPEQLDSKLSEMITDSEVKDISEYKAIIAMGGDGILFEIMQGIHARADEKEILEMVKFGIIGCGTSNGLAKSILHWSDVSFLLSYRIISATNSTKKHNVHRRKTTVR